VKQDQVPTARVRGSLPPLAPAQPGTSPHGFVRPLYTLYSPGQAALATFLGTPLAGCWLLARNFKNLGSPAAGWGMLVLGLCWTAVLCTLGILDMLPGIVSLGSIPAMVLVMRAVQGSELDRHLSLGGRKTSWGYVIAAGVACLAIIVAAVFTSVVAYTLLTRAPSIEAPGGGEVMYTDGATEDDAKRLRDALSEMEYFDGPYTVQVHREGARWVVSYVLQEVALRDARMSRTFGDLADEVSRRAFAGAPVDTVLMDDRAHPHQRFSFESRLRTLAIGDDEIRYRDLTEDQARKISSVLTAQRYFGDGGAVAMANRDLRIEIELWMPEGTTTTPLDDLQYQVKTHELSRELGDVAVDLVLGDLEGKQYKNYRWPDLLPAPVEVEDGTLVFYRDGATREEAQRVGEVVLEHDERREVLYAIVMRDENFEPARAVVAIYVEDDDDLPKLERSLHRFAEPLSKAAFGNTPVDLRLIDDKLELRAALSWEKRPKSRGAIRPTR
jgi:hypothetical protein